MSLGHSAAMAYEAAEGFDAGASAVTHLFNAMEPLSARYPGLAGAALARKDIAIQLIGDGVHVSDELLIVAFASAPGRCIIVSDSIAAAACDQEFVQLGDVTVHIRNGQAMRSDGTLAGSIGKLRDSVVRIAHLGISKTDTLNSVISRPATLIGVTKSIELKPGEQANFLVLDEQLQIAKRVRDGVVVEANA